MEEPYIPDFDNRDCSRCPKCKEKTLIVSGFFGQVECLNPNCNYKKKFSEEQRENYRNECIDRR